MTYTVEISGKDVIVSHPSSPEPKVLAGRTWHAELVRQLIAERDELRAECEVLRAGNDRYEVARRMNATSWRDALQLNMLTGKPFDQIIDELRPFYFPAKTIDAAREVTP